MNAKTRMRRGSQSRAKAKKPTVYCSFSLDPPQHLPNIRLRCPTFDSRPYSSTTPPTHHTKNFLIKFVSTTCVVLYVGPMHNPTIYAKTVLAQKYRWCIIWFESLHNGLIEIVWNRNVLGKHFAVDNRFQRFGQCLPMFA